MPVLDLWSSLPTPSQYLFDCALIVFHKLVPSPYILAKCFLQLVPIRTVTFTHLIWNPLILLIRTKNVCQPLPLDFHTRFPLPFLPSGVIK